MFNAVRVSLKIQTKWAFFPILRHTGPYLLAAMSMPQEASNYDEVSMQQSLLFSDSLKDLKNLRTQLYSAAEYFELSYANDDQKQIVIETLKDYAVKAIVNTVDHLGSVTYKVNEFLDEKVDDVSGTELQVSCVEEKVRKCQEYIDLKGISQQSLMINTPMYHKRRGDHAWCKPEQVKISRMQTGS
ncbi:Protein ABIL3 [Gossypium arboreum]|uniref:Protein ABIL3 n=1 Tax=Gossypium arboreum TaxID=29729 RepID=A0A0B0MTW9_GOSAR|nr:Protein ABIL3 [Gossypium arboreum]